VGKVVICFVHIPKTAGTSFRHGLMREFGPENFLLDYGADDPETSEDVRCLYKQNVFNSNRIVEFIEKDQADVICGHFPVSRYLAAFPGATIISFVREPLQRCYSEFLHFQRLQNYTKPFETFIQLKRAINIQSIFLKGLPVNSIIGISEYYNQSVQLFNTKLNLSIPVFDLNCNRENLKKPYAEKVIGKEAVSLFYELNQEDVQLYQKILSQFLEEKNIWKGLFSGESASAFFSKFKGNINKLASSLSSFSPFNSLK